MTAHAPRVELDRWLLEYDPADSDPARLTKRFVEGLRSLGLPICRASLWLPTAHPELWGNQVIWAEETGCEVLQRPHQITETTTFIDTPGEAVHKARHSLRWRLDVTEREVPFPMLLELKRAGITDYLIVPFQNQHVAEQPWMAFATRAAGGFSDAQVEEVQTLCGPMGWKARVAIAEQATRSLLRVYLGPNAAERVLEGQFRRGRGQEIRCVVWFCDLRGFTALGDRMPAPELVTLLDQHFERVAGAIEDAGGEILKFVGDAVLAVFPCSDQPELAATRALDAARAALQGLATWSEEQRAAGRPGLTMGVALHIGSVFYGNIGGRSRLDFTVIGSTVNEAARVESLCKEVGVPLLATRAFAEVAGLSRLVGVGDHSLRGVSKPQALYTLPELLPANHG